MRLETVLFASESFERYERMVRVLELSAAENSPATPLTIHRIDSQDEELRVLARTNCKRLWIDNARKARHHQRIIRDAADGDVLCLIDADTMILGDLSEIGSLDFDLAYTVRPPGSKWKLNTGVYFVRVSDRVRRFCYLWLMNVEKMLADVKFHEHWRKQKRYGGIHQAAFGCQLEALDEADPLIHALPLPCETWNCVSRCWDSAESPKIVHIMGQLRQWCFDKPKPRGERERQLVARWREYDGRSRAA